MYAINLVSSVVLMYLGIIDSWTKSHDMAEK